MGSTGGTIDEARVRLESDGMKTNHITIRQIHPFPGGTASALLGEGQESRRLENNATGQLADLIKLHVGHATKSQAAEI